MKLLILGKGPSLFIAPPEFDGEVWGVNDLMKIAPKRRFTRWFELHEQKHWADELKDLQIPVYMQQVNPDIPNSVAYPLDRIIDKFGSYFTNTISYMLALAVDEGFEEIHLYGADMQMKDEYAYQVPSIEYFLGIAVGQGIGIFISNGSTLLKTNQLYAFNREA